MVKEANTGKHHRHAVLVRGGSDGRVLHRTARLRDEADAALGGLLGRKRQQKNELNENENENKKEKNLSIYFYRQEILVAPKHEGNSKFALNKNTDSKSRRART